jgi:hypothetical protein
LGTLKDVLVRFLVHLFWIFLLAFSANALAERRVALVIGNDGYETIPPLFKAAQDARSIGDVLEQAGFEVTSLKDATYREMAKAIDVFSRDLAPDDKAVFFFAGHGVQLKSGNYILPVDVDAENEGMVERTSYGLDDITFLLGKHRSGFQLIIVDACRDNPFPARTRSFGNTRGLVPVEAVKGQMIMYSASRGQQALDRLGPADTNPNGVFTRKLMESLTTPGLSALEVIRDVQDEVEELAASVDHEQRPSVYNESRGDFYFFGRPKSKISDPEKDLWEEIKVIGNLDAFGLYLDSYPQGKYTSLARAYVTKLKNDIKPNRKERSELKAEMELWDSAKEENSYGAYEQYLEQYPAGFFSAVAEDYIELLDTQKSIQTYEKYASNDDQWLLDNDRKLLAMTEQRVNSEAAVRYALAEKLLKLDVPTF